MSRTVYLHIGAPKTGTTYLQDRLSRNVRTLAQHDVHVPTGSMFVSPALFQFRAALDLLDQDWGGAPGHAEGAWPALVKQVRRRSGTVVVSHEIFAPAPATKIAKLMNDLQGSEVHIVYSARDLARQLPAAWQESIKQGRRWKFRTFLDKAEKGDAWFMRAFDLPTVLNTWTRNLPPERVHVVTVPPSGSAPTELWERFCTVFGIDPAWAPLDSERANESLGIAETQLLRQLNRRIDRRTRRSAPHDQLIGRLLASNELVSTSSRRVELPPEREAWAAEQAERWIDWVRGSGVHVIGDVDDLRPRPRGEGVRWRNPDTVSNKALSRAALQALAVMTKEAAKRPDPERELGARIKRRAQEWRSR
ncbi:hypothetical protein [Nocardioides donggukensis]|uniref:Sulfotransferase family protein n=1 Tax=Nocardioides donggukensis TaxID=2774019 RepID=A0A927Q0S7_9ACTN|nr:hypothetical protein [Nocardioides donggukensis]MBD8868081.1 hypothetical protein [Nocardioides donggukensis]